MDDELETAAIYSMDTAPKDGTLIILFWRDERSDIRIKNVRVASWWTPTHKCQTSDPHWEYINDKDFCMSVKNPIGWMPIPNVLKALEAK